MFGDCSRDNLEWMEVMFIESNTWSDDVFQSSCQLPTYSSFQQFFSELSSPRELHVMNYFTNNVVTLQLLTDHHEFEITLTEQTLERKEKT